MPEVNFPNCFASDLKCTSNSEATAGWVRLTPPLLTNPLLKPTIPPREHAGNSVLEVQ